MRTAEHARDSVEFALAFVAVSGPSALVDLDRGVVLATGGDTSGVQLRFVEAALRVSRDDLEAVVEHDDFLVGRVSERYAVVVKKTAIPLAGTASRDRLHHACALLNRQYRSGSAFVCGGGHGSRGSSGSDAPAEARVVAPSSRTSQDN